MLENKGLTGSKTSNVNSSLPIDIGLWSIFFTPGFPPRPNYCWWENLYWANRSYESTLHFLRSIGEKTANTVTSQAKSYKDFLGPACVTSMAVIPVNYLDISMIIKNLRGTSASGFDHVHKKALKAVLPSVLQLLTHLINLSLRKGVFPSLPKKARIVPLHKGGPQNDPSNFRPISISW